MESASRSSGDEDEFVRTQASSSQRVDLTMRVDGNRGEQKHRTPTTPRSKHSATEQRRRCKINDRFQILRDLIPHSDQKRDKASFLLEVIEYVKFLQEKVQKYESYPGWTHESEKFVQWSNHEGLSDGAPMSLSNHNVAEADMSAGAAAVLQSNYYASVGRESGEERLIAESGNLVSQSQSEWQQRSSGSADCNASFYMMNEHEELTIDEGTISISSVYSQGLLTAFTHAVASSGIDLSDASISAQINLGRRAITRPSVTSTMPSAKDPDYRETMEDTRGRMQRRQI